MNDFFKSFFACLLAIVVSGFAMVVLFIMTIGVLGTILEPTTVSVKKGTILKITLSENISDNPGVNLYRDLDLSTMKMPKSLSLLDAIMAIEGAKNDDRISGIYLEVSAWKNPGIASLQELRAALADFKTSGKFIVSYSEIYSQSNYYISSVADKVFLNPDGEMIWLGMSSQAMFFKGTLDKLGVEPEIIRHGKYKSAVEPFMTDKMSPENREQSEMLVSSIWGNLLSSISASRGVDSAMLQNYASNLSIASPESALKANLVDGLKYKDEIENYLKETTKSKDLRVISLSDYSLSTKPQINRVSKNKVAVIYAEGDIVDGDAKGDVVGSATISKQIRDARKDSSIRAVVLRVNSPGGSALAAAVIWRELVLLQKEKPLVVSMGNYAASGGYYIAAPADVIVASPATITGSIGIFGVMFNAEKGLKDKLGITFDRARTNPSADMFGITRPLTPTERAFMQRRIDEGYNLFVSRVASGRNLAVADVDSIAEGRVWSGANAVNIGLVDGLGGIRDAVNIAADRAGLASDFRIYNMTQTDGTLGQIISALGEAKVFGISFGKADELADSYNYLRSMLSGTPIKAAMPYTITVE